MYERYSLIGLAFSLIIIFLDFYLLRKRKIQGRGFVFWFLVGAILGLFSVVPSLISAISFIFGTEFAISSVFAAGFLFSLLAIFYLHSKITELRDLMLKLTMEISLIKYDREQVNRSQRKSNPKTLESNKKHTQRSSKRRVSSQEEREN